LLLDCHCLPRLPLRATIKASATVPATCSVVGNEGIDLALGDDGLLGGGAVNLQVNGGGVDFQLTESLLTVPAAANPSNHNAQVLIAASVTVLVGADRRGLNVRPVSAAPIAKNLIAAARQQPQVMLCFSWNIMK
jgi:hypothetical protein